MVIVNAVRCFIGRVIVEGDKIAQPIAVTSSACTLLLIAFHDLKSLYGNSAPQPRRCTNTVKAM